MKSKAYVPVLFIAAVLCLSPAASAALLFSASAPNVEGGDITPQPASYLWGGVINTTIPYYNVMFSTSMVATAGATDVDLEVYLTDQMGPGTTGVNEVASAAFQVNLAASGARPPLTITSVDLLSVGTLPVGSYYLMVVGRSSSGPGSPNFLGSFVGSMTIINHPGFGMSNLLASFSPDPYLPATMPAYWGLGFRNWFTVTGDLSPDPVGVPEPSTLGFVIGGLTLLGLLRQTRLGRR